MITNCNHQHSRKEKKDCGLFFGGQKCGKENNEQKQTNKWCWPHLFHERVAMHLQINK